MKLLVMVLGNDTYNAAIVRSEREAINQCKWWERDIKENGEDYGYRTYTLYECNTRTKHVEEIGTWSPNDLT